jgi:hypothetical protein
MQNASMQRLLSTTTQSMATLTTPIQETNQIGLTFEGPTQVDLTWILYDSIGTVKTKHAGTESLGER